ncbi:MAG: hypothetical protein QM500_15650 [Methylococcales bacterium]
MIINSVDEEMELKTKYKCTGSNNDGWCDGTANGKSMRCPKVLFTKKKERVCKLGVKNSLNIDTNRSSI